MTFVYFGSFHVSADILEGIVTAGMLPFTVICSPDRPSGRNKVITPPAVKKLILEKSWPIQILQPEKPTDILAELKTLAADFFVVMGYPHIIPNSILQIPKLGTIGVHPSLLPAYRGASPMQSALLAGETETGVTLYQMDSKMDHGPILAKGTVPITNSETNVSLEKKCAGEAAKLLIETLPKFVAGKIVPIEQDHGQATFTRKFTSEDGRVDMTQDAPETIYRKIIALNPEPSVWTMNFPGREGMRVKLLAAERKNDVIRISLIQPDGKKPMPVNQFIG